MSIASRSNDARDVQVVATPEWVVNGRRDRRLVPDIIEGWETVVSRASRGECFTDFGNRIIAVPAGDGVKARAARLHELAHAQFSPADFPPAIANQVGVRMSSIRSAEEMRVNVLLSRSHETRGVIVELSDGTEASMADDVVEREAWSEAVQLLATTYGTKAFRNVKRRLKLNKAWRENVETVKQKLDRFVKHYHLNYKGSTEPVEVNYPRGVHGRASVFIPRDFLDATMPLANLIEDLCNESFFRKSAEALPEGEIGEQGGKPDISALHDGWETLFMGYAPLTEPASSFMGRKRRPSVVGKTIRHPERLLTDPERRVFTQDLRGASGIVVVDSSGSMSLTHEQLVAILKASPGCTVIAYSHSRHGRPNSYVLAHKGRRVTEEVLNDLSLGAGNGVDLPALRWAIRQRKTPKEFILWITDGMVTGRSDRHHNDLVKECANFVHKHRISVADDWKKGVEYLHDYARGKPFPAITNPSLKVT